MKSNKEKRRQDIFLFSHVYKYTREENKNLRRKDIAACSVQLYFIFSSIIKELNTITDYWSTKKWSFNPKGLRPLDYVGALRVGGGNTPFFLYLLFLSSFQATMELNFWINTSLLEKVKKFGECSVCRQCLKFIAK